MSDKLTTEIVKRIIMDVGAAPGIFGARGLTDPNFKLVKTITVKYDFGNQEHEVYAGKISLKEGSFIKGLLIDLSGDEYDEYLFMFRMDQLPVYAAQILYDDSYEDQGSIKRLVKKTKDDEEYEVWEPIGMFQKARLLADFERIVSWGILWEDCKEISDLYDAAVKVIDSQRY